MKDRKKKDDWDDGRVIAPMDGVGPSRPKNDESSKLRKNVKVEVTRKEQKAMTRGMFAALLPRILCSLLGFAAAVVLMYLWLS